MSSKAHYWDKKKRQTKDILKSEHNITDRAQARTTDTANGGAITVEIDYP